MGGSNAYVKLTTWGTNAMEPQQEMSPPITPSKHSIPLLENFIQDYHIRIAQILLDWFELLCHLRKQILGILPAYLPKPSRFACAGAQACLQGLSLLDAAGSPKFWKEFDRNLFSKKECPQHRPKVQVWNAVLASNKLLFADRPSANQVATRHGWNPKWVASKLTTAPSYMCSQVLSWNWSKFVVCEHEQCFHSGHGLEKTPDIQLVSGTLQKKCWAAPAKWAYSWQNRARKTGKKKESLDQIETLQGCSRKDFGCSVFCAEHERLCWCLGLDLTFRSVELARLHNPSLQKTTRVGIVGKNCAVLAMERTIENPSASSHCNIEFIMLVCYRSATEEDSVTSKKKGTHEVWRKKCIPCLGWPMLFPTNWNTWLSLLQVQPLPPSLLVSVHVRVQMQNWHIFNLQRPVRGLSQHVGPMASAASLPRMLSRFKAKLYSNFRWHSCERRKALARVEQFSSVRGPYNHLWAPKAVAQYTGEEAVENKRFTCYQICRPRRREAWSCCIILFFFSLK